MADLSTELNQIKNAIYGKDVRASLATGIEKINQENENTSDVVKKTLVEVNKNMSQFSLNENKREENEKTRVDNFASLRNEITDLITTGGNEVSKLEVLEKEYSSKIDELNTINTLDTVKNDLKNLATKQNSDITWTNGNVTINTKELEKFTYSKINTFNCEKSKTGVVKIWGYRAVSSSDKGVWVTVQLPFELPNKNYVVNLTVVDGKVDSSFRRIKLGNNQSRTSFDIFIDWAVGFNFEVICSP